MKNPFFAASYESGVELMAAGCPLDYPDALPHQSFRVEQLPGYGDSRVYELGPFDTGWVIPVGLRTDRQSGTIISHVNFEHPWQHHDIDWECEPEDIIPEKDQVDYKHLFKSRLKGGRNQHRLIRCGCPVEGILCGRLVQPIGEYSHGFISAKLSVTDDLGNTVPLSMKLSLFRLRLSSARRFLGEAVPHRLFRHVDPEGRLDPSAIPAGGGFESGSQRGEAATYSADLL